MITLPTLKELQQKIRNDLVLSINSGQTDPNKKVDPNINNSFIGGLADSMSAGFNENNYILLQVLNELFPQTSQQQDILDMWGSFYQITRKQPTQAEGYAIFTGTNNTLIPNGTFIQKADGTQYTTQADTTILTQSILASSLTRVNSTATFTATAPHNLATGMTVIISGAHNHQYNITATITAISDVAFTYQVSGNPPSPDIHTNIIATATFAYVKILADNSGSIGNSAGGSQMELVSPILNVDDTCYITYDGLYNGIDQESQEDFRTRILNRIGLLLESPLSVANIENTIKENIAGITRVWVQPATPSHGYFTVYFTRDNDANIIPTANQNLQVKTLLKSVAEANIADANIVVNSVSTVAVNFVFSSLSPATQAMKTAITTELKNYFKSEQVAVGQNVSLRELNSVLYNVIDSNGSEPTFTLSSPSADIVITSSQLPILGTITF